MADAQVVVTEANDATPAIGGVFAGLRLFLVQRLPMRSTFVNKIQANGGRIVKLETQADHVIADHVRLDCPPGSLSFTFIDAAINSGALPDPEDHRAGPIPGAIRVPGPGVPGRTTRTPFTADDDRVLWQWVERARKDGAYIKGNKIYEQLEAVNGRHTYQAWRDRYVKRLMDNPPDGAQVNVSANPPPSPPTAQDAEVEVTAQAGVDGTVEAGKPDQLERVEGNDESDGYTVLPEDDVESLLQQAADIENIAEDQVEDAWASYAETFGRHSAQKWQEIWLDEARPVYLKQLARGQNTQTQPSAAVETREGSSRQSSSSKRKRASKSPEKTYGKKKRKSTSAEIFEEDGNEPLSQHNRVAVVPEIVQVRDVDMNTSDANAAAQRQFDEEVFGGSAVYVIQSEQQLPTSEVNKAADEQIRRESIGSVEYVDLANGDENLIERSTEFVAVNHGGIDAATVAQPQALTVANLASQQAEHASDPHRAVDLPPDDEDEEANQQKHFVSYLQDLNRQSGQLQGAETNKPQWEQQSQDDGAELPDITSALVHNPLTHDLAAASQQEVDEAIESFMSWPDSPDYAQKQQAPRVVAAASQFQSQVVYPSLPDQNHVQLDAIIRQESKRTPTWPALNEHSESSQSQDAAVEEDANVWSSQPRNEMRASQKTGGYALSDGVNPLPPSEGVDEEDELEYAVPRAAASQGLTHKAQPKGSDVVSVRSTSPSSLSSDNEEPSDDEEPTPRQHQKQVLETQDILDAETQMPDFTMPLPPSSPNASSCSLPSDPLDPPSSPPNTRALESQQALADTQALSDDGLDSYISTMAVRGFSETSVMNALKATSMRPELAHLVLLEEKIGKGVPRDVPGIWTEEDDGYVESGNARAMRGVEKKHGWDEMLERLRFLQEWRDAGEEEEGVE